MHRILLISIAFHVSFSLSCLASRPPVASFLGFGSGYDESITSSYALACSNAAVQITEGVKELHYQHNTKSNLSFNEAKNTAHGESVVVTCDTQNGYYESSTSKDSYTITCDSGVWKNSSLCVKKCKFFKSEFTIRKIAQGQNVGSETSALQFEVVNFETATAPSKYSSVQKSGSTYYVNAGESVKITCPATHIPFTADSSKVNFIDLTTNSFTTTCLPSNERNKNAWSNYATCYNGYKPCNNSEVVVKTEGLNIYTDNGEHFKEFGGSMVDPNGKTFHGGRLKMACNQYPWYQNHDYVAPTCKDGKWTSSEAYCKAYSCTVEDIFNMASKLDGGQVANNIEQISTSPDKKLYYDQSHIFKCKHSNRSGTTLGKAFKCIWNATDVLAIVESKEFSTDWYNNFCVNQNYCDLSDITDAPYRRINTGESLTTVIPKHDAWQHSYEESILPSWLQPPNTIGAIQSITSQVIPIPNTLIPETPSEATIDAMFQHSYRSNNTPYDQDSTFDPIPQIVYCKVPFVGNVPCGVNLIPRYRITDYYRECRRTIAAFECGGTGVSMGMHITDREEAYTCIGGLMNINLIDQGYHGGADPKTFIDCSGEGCISL